MENNFNLTGDEARILMAAMRAEGVSYPGPMLPMAADLLVRLNNISMNQPPTQPEETPDEDTQ